MKVTICFNNFPNIFLVFLSSLPLALPGSSPKMGRMATTKKLAGLTTPTDFFYLLNTAGQFFPSGSANSYYVDYSKKTISLLN